MAAVTRTTTRALFRASTPATSAFRPVVRSSRFALPNNLRAGSRRGYASEAGAKSSTGTWLLIAGLVGVGGYGAYRYQAGEPLLPKSQPTKDDYQKVYDEIAKMLDSDDYDDGSYGPVSILPERKRKK